MDCCIKTDRLEHVGKPIYFISLQTEKAPNLSKLSCLEKTTLAQETVKFACNIEELQDLVSKLKDATKQIERVQSDLQT